MTYTPRMSKCEKHGTEREWPENCRECDQDAREERETAHANRVAALLAAGFSEPFATGGIFGAEFVSCLTCGAAVALTALQEGQSHPLDLHQQWHART